MMAIYGYARVSTDGQSLNAQRDALKAAGCGKVFSEKESGAKTDRTQLARAIAALQSGDVLIITRLDRLARSTRDLLNVLAAIADKQAGFKSLNEPMIDTTSAHGKLVTGILACIGEFERELIRARTGEGRERAKADGVRFGRPAKLNHFQMKEARRRAEAGESERAIARIFNVTQPTIHRLLTGQTLAAGKTS